MNPINNILGKKKKGKNPFSVTPQKGTNYFSKQAVSRKANNAFGPQAFGNSYFGQTMKGASQGLQKQWSNFSRPVKQQLRNIYPDKDKDGVPNRWDCQPNNPYRQESKKRKVLQNKKGEWLKLDKNLSEEQKYKKIGDFIDNDVRDNDYKIIEAESFNPNYKKPSQPYRLENQWENQPKDNKLTDKEVDNLYKSNPDLDNPYYPKKLLKKYPDESADLEIDVKGKKYVVHSDPNTGKDEWKSDDVAKDVFEEYKKESRASREKDTPYSQRKFLLDDTLKITGKELVDESKDSGIEDDNLIRTSRELEPGKDAWIESESLKSGDTHIINPLYIDEREEVTDEEVKEARVKLDEQLGRKSKSDDAEIKEALEKEDESYLDDRDKE